MRRRVFDFIEGFPEQELLARLQLAEDDIFLTVLRGYFFGGFVHELLVRYPYREGSALDRQRAEVLVTARHAGREGARSRRDRET